MSGSEEMNRIRGGIALKNTQSERVDGSEAKGHKKERMLAAIEGVFGGEQSRIRASIKPAGLMGK